MKTRYKQNVESISYSMSTWLRNLFILTIGLLLVVFILSKNYEYATVNLVSSLNEEFSIHADQMSTQIQDAVITSAMQIYFSPSVTTLRTSDHLTNFEGILGIRTMNAGMVSSNLIHSIYVYNEEKDYIFTTYEIGSFYSHEFFDKTGTMMLTNPDAYPKLTPIHREILWDLDEEPDVVYSFLVHDRTSEYNNGSMLINIFAQSYNNIFFNSTTDTNDYLLLLNKDFQIMAASDAYRVNTMAEEMEAIDQHILLNHLPSDEGSGYFINKDRGSKTIYFYTHMPQSGWYFVKVIAYADCMAGLKNMIYYTIVIALILIICGFLIAYISMKRFYSPLKKIMATLSPVHEGMDDQQTDIVGDFDLFIANQKEVSDSYNSLLKSEFLKHILLSTSSVDPTITNKFNLYKIPFIDGKPYYLVLLQMPSDLESDHQDFDKPLIDLNQDSIIHHESLTIAGQDLLIIQSQEALSIESLCQTFIDQGYSLCIFSISVYDIRDLRKSYIRLQELRRLHIFYPDRNLLSEAWLLKKNKENHDQSYFESQILHYLKASDLKQAIENYHQQIDQCKDHRFSVILFNLKSLYLTIDTYYLALLKEYKNVEKNVDIDGFEKKILSAKTIDDINTIFIDHIRATFELQNDLSESKQVHICNQVKAYIDDNYTDYNLTQSGISYFLDISQSKLSKAFKLIEGMTVSDYINQIRIEKSMELLVKTDMTIKEITQLVGIENTKYFYTLFKNKTQLTPSSYRQVERIKDNDDKPNS